MTLILRIFLAGFLWLGGCAAKEQIVYETVYQVVRVPVACRSEMPERPVVQKSPALDLTEVLHYVENLEILLKSCMAQE